MFLSFILRELKHGLVGCAAIVAGVVILALVLGALFCIALAYGWH